MPVLDPEGTPLAYAPGVQRSAVANAAAPTHGEGRAAPLSVDLAGALRSTDAGVGAATDPEATGDGSTIAVLKRIRTLLAGGLPASLGQKAAAASLAVVSASDDPVALAAGATTDAEATANGSIIAVLKRLRTLNAGGLPASLGQKTAAGSLAVVSASDDPVALAAGATTDAEATGNGSVIAILKRMRTVLGGTLLVRRDPAEQTYFVSALGIVPDTNPTDLFTLTPGANVVRLRRALIQLRSTAADSVTVSLVRRTAANTGGTFTSSAGGVLPLDASNTAHDLASVGFYTANPTALGAGGSVSRRRITSVVNGTPLDSNGLIDWSGLSVGQQPTFRGAADFLAVNLGGAAMPAGLTVDLTFEFTLSA